MPEKSYPSSKYTTLFFLCLLITSAALTVHLLFGFLTPVVMALVTVSVCYPLYNRLCKKLKGRNYLAAWVATVGVFLCIIIPLSLFFFALSQEALSFYQATVAESAKPISSLVESLRGHLINLQRNLKSLGIHIAPERILSLTGDIVQKTGEFFYTNLSFIAANTLVLLFDFVLMIALVFIFFVSGAGLRDFMVDIVPLPKDELDRLSLKFRELSSAVFIGNGIISVSEGIIGGFLFFAFGLTGALIWGAVIAVASFLPLIGGWVVILPATVYLFLMGNTTQALIFFSLNLLSLGVMEMLIKPKLVGTKSQMHAALVFLSVFAGIQIYGAFGLFYGPLVVTMFLSLVEIYKDHYRDELIKKP